MPTAMAGVGPPSEDGQPFKPAPLRILLRYFQSLQTAEDDADTSQLKHAVLQQLLQHMVPSLRIFSSEVLRMKKVIASAGKDLWTKVQEVASESFTACRCLKTIFEETNGQVAYTSRDGVLFKRRLKQLRAGCDDIGNRVHGFFWLLYCSCARCYATCTPPDLYPCQ